MLAAPPAFPAGACVRDADETADGQPPVPAPWPGTR